MPLSRFAEGWMCPIYKKKDRAEIENYRPITVLNTDYKILTRALTSRLGAVASNIIHKDQAGFMKGRRIENHTDLIHLLTRLCSIKDENGAIICLDQEKAYDRVRHDFLWATLEKFNFPETFINTVKSLYQHAKTAVMINGVLSAPYKVTRGVRQGDPLSCLLFNLAIESLAETLRTSRLKGLKIDNEDRLIASLFADDTTVYLSSEDNMEYLYTILENWCKASGAKFNVAKTEIIPLGSKTYREQLVHTRKLNHNAQPINNNIHIAEPGEPVRVLGAWIGHELDQTAIWNRVLEETNEILNRWSKSHPTQEGRRLIIGMYVAGKTQFLARVQGMPQAVEQRLTKMIYRFMWDKDEENFSPPIQNGILTDTIEQGGRKVLDIKARNEAIDLMKLKTYLSPEPERPQWAKVMDELIRRSVPKSSPAKDMESRTHMFLQTWKPTLQEGSRLPENVVKMLKTAQKYQLTFNPNIVANEVKTQLPIWHHIGLDKTRSPQHNRETSRCLRKVHHITTVAQMTELANTTLPANHKQKATCNCNTCESQREIGCRNPQLCIRNANRWVNALHPKWNPRHPNPPEIENPTTILQPGTQSPSKNPPASEFNADILTRELYDGFTILGDPKSVSICTPARIPNDPVNNTNDEQNKPPETEVEILVQCTHENEARVVVNIYVWVKDQNDLNKKLKIEGGYINAHTGELAAIRYIAKTVHTGKLTIMTASNKISTIIINKKQDLENTGHKTKNEELLRSTLAYLRARNGQTVMRPGKCTNTSIWAEEQDLDDQIEAIDIHDIDAPENFRITGNKIRHITQASVYRAIINFNESQKRIRAKNKARTDWDGNSNRRATRVRLDITRHAILENTNMSPTDEYIWKSIRNKTISKNIRAFLWTAMHDGQKCGEYWTRMTSYEHRGMCRECNTIKGLEHILTECRNSGQEQIWHLARDILQAKGINIQRLNLGKILGSGVPQILNSKGKIDRTKSRLYTIIMTESSHLIWKIRCEWKIGRAEDPNKKHTNQEITNRWRQVINTRLKLDCLQTNSLKFGNKSISMNLVRDTWKGTLDGEEDLPNDWMRYEVLVGIRQIQK
ncbi:hypothetical protein CVT24_001827 [Panaeolus cyanescens]|uniref:Reverse transcriptase domain-containing protein n=1 Tax=Panaeolus cyanescens TaxID=181874 RepID=A0A409WSA9_9AGAR|nr:hypothetical protein CVT24_001827 [Panaeolus cyanescens]